MAKKKRERRQRGLVLGHLERISSRAFDKHNREITDLIGKKHGIYALYRNNNLYYVGLATNLKSRVSQHLRDRHKGKWNYFSLYLVRSEKNLKELESLLLRIADPSGNRTRGRLLGSKDLGKPLKRGMVESARREISDLFSDGKSHKQLAPSSTDRKRAGKKAAATRRKRLKAKVVLNGLIKNQSVRGHHKGVLHRAWVLTSGRIKIKATREVFDSPSSAAEAVVGHKKNGWTFWTYRGADGRWHKLSELRA